MAVIVVFGLHRNERSRLCRKPEIRSNGTRAEDAMLVHFEVANAGEVDSRGGFALNDHKRAIRLAKD